MIEQFGPRAILLDNHPVPALNIQVEEPHWDDDLGMWFGIYFELPFEHHLHLCVTRANMKLEDDRVATQRIDDKTGLSVGFPIHPDIFLVEEYLHWRSRSHLLCKWGRMHSEFEETGNRFMFDECQLWQMYELYSTGRLKLDQVSNLIEIRVRRRVRL